MKLYNLFIATFFVLINFSVGVPIPTEDETRDNVYSSYEKNLELLKKNKLEYLEKDLGEAYKDGFRLVNAFWDFFKDKQNLLDDLERSYNILIKCHIELNDTMNYYEDELEKLSKEMEKSPKSSTCFEDLVIYFGDVKHHMREELKSVDIHNSHRVPNMQLMERLEERFKASFKLPDSLKKSFEFYVQNYIYKMIHLNKEKAKKKDIRAQSKKDIELMFFQTEDLLKIHREDVNIGMLNENGVLSVIESFNEIRQFYKQMNKQLNSEIINFRKHISANIDLMERLATATFYIIDDKNNKKLLDCEDRLPYLACRPLEYLMKVETKNKLMDPLFTGTGQDGRTYKRQLIYLEENVRYIKVRETIEYDDEVFDRTYYIEFADRNRNHTEET